MSDFTDFPTEDLRRVPGLFRRWELSELLEPDRRYHIEDAGAHADGTPLVALYAADAAHRYQVCPAGSYAAQDANMPKSPSPSVTEQFIGQRELAGRWKISPRTLERWRRVGRGPTYLKLGFRIVYGLTSIQAFEAQHRQLPRGVIDKFDVRCRTERRGK